MTQEEKKEKRLYLWAQTRRYFWQQIIINRMRRALQSEVRVEPIDDTAIDSDGNYVFTQNHYLLREQEKIKWYMIDPAQSIPQGWSVIMYIFTIYTLFATPYV